MPHAPFRPLDDRPLDGETAQRLYADTRLQPTVECITRQLEAWLQGEHASPSDIRQEAPRIGLFGGLGQGKSSVINLCLEKLQDEREKLAPLSWIKSRDWIFGPPIVRFDVSHFKAEDLEWRFLTAVLWQRIRHSSRCIWLPMFGALSATATYYLITPRFFEKSALGQLVTVFIGAVTIAGMVTALSKLLSITKDAIAIREQVSPAANLYVSRREWGTYVLATLTGTLPRLVFVDDLDRAKVEQQRAFLRAILRFSRQMNFAVVVCMDESAVLASQPDPEAPEELLRKTIQLELHLPDRNREDIAFLAINLCNEAAHLNPSWGALLRHPQWIGDLVRCLLLLGPIGTLSPRRVKHFLNAVVTRVEQLDTHAVDDCCALLRLEGLLTLLPALRRHPGALLDALETNRVEAFEQILSTSTNSSDNHAAAVRYFARTRSMQPRAHDGWFLIIGGFGVQKKSGKTPPTIAPEVPGDLKGRCLDLLRLMSLAIDHVGQGYARRLNLSASSKADPNTGLTSRVFEFHLGSGSYVRFAPEELPDALTIDNAEGPLAFLYWPLWLGSLAQADTPIRDRLYRCAEKWLQEIPERSGTQATLADLLRRERLADHEVWPLLPQQERRRLLAQGSTQDALASHRLSLTALQNDEVEHAMTEYLSVSHRNVWREAKWLAAQMPAKPSEQLGSQDLSALLPIWPNQLVTNGSGWSQHLRGQTGQELSVGAGRYALPHRLAASWRVWSAGHLDTCQCLDVLQAAAFSQSTARWSLPRLAAWLDAEHPDHAPAFQTPYPAELEQLRNENNALDWSAANLTAMTPLRCLTAIALAYHCGWILSENLVANLSKVPVRLRRGLAEAMLMDNSTASKWLKTTEQNFIVALLHGVLALNQAEDNVVLAQWQSLISGHRPADDAEIFAKLLWPPPALPLP